MIVVGDQVRLSVIVDWVTTSYVYGADGSRLKRVVDDGSTVTTHLYLGEALEIVNPAPGASSSEITHWYLHPNLRHTETWGGTEVTFLHRDQLSSLVMMTDAAAEWSVERVFAPFGEDTEFGNTPPAADPRPEDIEFIGERKDAAAGLHYLNARYYDTELSIFTQPDWLDPTEPEGAGLHNFLGCAETDELFASPFGSRVTGLCTPGHPAPGSGVSGRYFATIQT